MAFEVTVLSPEKTILTFRLARLGGRAGAQFVDLCIAFGGCLGITLGLSLLSAFLGGFVFEATSGVIIAMWVLGPFLYFILCEGLCNGQTLGKRMNNLRVRMADGTPVTFAAAIGRNLLRPADFFPALYFFGVIAIGINPNAQRIGDLVAGTIVCHEPRPTPIFAAAPHVAGIHPLEAHVGELRKMTMDEYIALRRFCDRYPELSSRVQQKLLAELWEPIAERHQVPSLPNVHPLYLAEAVVMKYGRQHGLL